MQNLIRLGKELVTTYLTLKKIYIKRGINYDKRKF